MISFCTFIIAAVVILYGAWATAANYGSMLFNVVCILLGYVVCKFTLSNPKLHKLTKEIKEYIYGKKAKICK